MRHNSQYAGAAAEELTPGSAPARPTASVRDCLVEDRRRYSLALLERGLSSNTTLLRMRRLSARAVRLYRARDGQEMSPVSGPSLQHRAPIGAGCQPEQALIAKGEPAVDDNRA